jgi:hypothetical protein
MKIRRVFQFFHTTPELDMKQSPSAEKKSQAITNEGLTVTRCSDEHNTGCLSDMRILLELEL